MTKKDYIALAAALKAVKPTYTPHDDTPDHGALAYHQWVRDVTAVMDVCVTDNRDFHKGKFMTACGVPNIGVK